MTADPIRPQPDEDNYAGKLLLYFIEKEVNRQTAGDEKAASVIRSSMRAKLVRAFGLRSDKELTEIITCHRSLTIRKDHISALEDILNVGERLFGELQRAFQKQTVIIAASQPASATQPTEDPPDRAPRKPERPRARHAGLPSRQDKTLIAGAPSTRLEEIGHQRQQLTVEEYNRLARNAIRDIFHGLAIISSHDHPLLVRTEELTGGTGLQVSVSGLRSLSGDAIMIRETQEKLDKLKFTGSQLAQCMPILENAAQNMQTVIIRLTTGLYTYEGEPFTNGLTITVRNMEELFTLLEKSVDIGLNHFSNQPFFDTYRATANEGLRELKEIINRAPAEMRYR